MRRRESIRDVDTKQLQRQILSLGAYLGDATRLRQPERK